MILRKLVAPTFEAGSFFLGVPYPKNNAERKGTKTAKFHKTIKRSLKWSTNSRLHLKKKRKKIESVTMASCRFWRNVNFCGLTFWASLFNGNKNKRPSHNKLPKPSHEFLVMNNRSHSLLWVWMLMNTFLWYGCSRMMTFPLPSFVTPYNVLTIRNHSKTR